MHSFWPVQDPPHESNQLSACYCDSDLINRIQSFLKALRLLSKQAWQKKPGCKVNMHTSSLLVIVFTLLVHVNLATILTIGT